MGLKIKFSNTYDSKIKRIKALPVKTESVMFSIVKHYCLSVIKNFHDGIKDMTFGLRELSDKTIVRKRRRGFSIPQAPIYAAGDDQEDDSYVNMLRIRKIDGFGKKGFQVYPSKKKHWESKLRLDELLDIHEKGRTITTKSGTTFRIPPRPALRKAYEKTLRDRKLIEPSKMVQKAIDVYLKTGNEKNLDKDIKALTKKWLILERHD